MKNAVIFEKLNAYETV